MDKRKLLATIIEIQNFLGSADGYLAVFELVVNDEVNKEAERLRLLVQQINLSDLQEKVEQL